MNVIITGASSGIGRELAKKYINGENRLFLIARRLDRLKELQKLDKNIEIFECDVSDFEKLEKIIKEIVSKNRIDLVIANAGISYPHSKDFMDFKEFKNTIDINFLSIHALLLHIVPQMKKYKTGKIVFISSLASIISSPTSLAYSASKRAINSYAEGLRNQLAPFGISVINILPGFIKSEMTAKNSFKMPFLLETDKGVNRIYRAIEKGKKSYPFPKRFYYLLKFINILPLSLKDRILQKL